MRGEFRGCVKLVTYLVLNKIKVNLPELILSHIIGFLRGHGNLGYGLVISRILSHFSAPRGKIGFVKRAIFNSERARKMGITPACTRPPFVSSSSSESSSSDSSAPADTLPPVDSVPAASISLQDIHSLVLSHSDSLRFIQDHMISAQDLVSIREYIDASEARIMAAIRDLSHPVPAAPILSDPAPVPSDASDHVSRVDPVIDPILPDLPFLDPIAPDPIIPDVHIVSPVHSPVLSAVPDANSEHTAPVSSEHTVSVPSDHTVPVSSSDDSSDFRWSDTSSHSEEVVRTGTPIIVSDVSVASPSALALVDPSSRLIASSSEIFIDSGSFSFQPGPITDTHADPQYPEILTPTPISMSTDFPWVSSSDVPIVDPTVAVADPPVDPVPIVEPPADLAPVSAPLLRSSSIDAWLAHMHRLFDEARASYR